MPVDDSSSPAEAVGDPAAVDVLGFARDLADLRSYLDWLHNYEDRSQEPYGPAVTALEALLQALEAGHGSVDSIRYALIAWREADKRQRDSEEKRRGWREADSERLAAEEAITRQVECPYCGSQPGASCRSTGESRQVQAYSHRGRFRLARSLNDGPPDDAV